MNKPYVLCDCRVLPRIGQSLKDRGFKPVGIPVHEAYDAPIAAHPDVFAFCNGDTVIAGAQTVQTIKEQMCREVCISFIVSAEAAGGRVGYPADCTLNAALCGDTLIGRKDSLDAVLIRYAAVCGYKIADVRQGYSKCNCAPVNGHALITEDKGIADVCVKNGMDVLLLRTHAVRLDGYDHGFIGGACGLYKDTLYVVGDITKHPEYDLIAAFAQKHGTAVESLCGGDVTDVGSLLFFGENAS